MIFFVQFQGWLLCKSKECSWLTSPVQAASLFFLAAALNEHHELIIASSQFCLSAPLRILFLCFIFTCCHVLFSPLKLLLFKRGPKIANLVLCNISRCVCLCSHAHRYRMMYNIVADNYIDYTIYNFLPSSIDLIHPW